MNREWFIVHKQIVTTYEQVQKDIFEEIKIENRMLLKKREKRLEGPRDIERRVKPDDIRNIIDVRKSDLITQ